MITASAAPNILDTAPAPAASGGSPGTSTSPSPFDAILMLQNLAGTGEMLDTGALEAGDTADLIGLDDSDEDEESGDDIEASLAFLSALISATTPRNSAGDLSADSGGQGAAGDSAPAAPVKAGDFLEAATQALVADAGETEGELAAALTPVKPEATENRGDDGQSLGRAADLLAQLQRPNPVSSEKPVVATHVRDPRWADDFGNRIALMVRAGESTASLQITPVDLGPVEVNVTVREGQASIHFGATQAETRQLLEASLPKLREMLASQGFNLLDASVSSGFSRSQQPNAAGLSRGEGSEGDVAVTEARPVRALGLLDLYA